MSRYRSITATLLRILLAVLFAIQGILKLAGSSSWISRFQEWGYSDGARLAVGLAEVVGAALLLTPRFARFGALLLIVIMIGAAATHMFNREPQLMTAVIVGALLGVVFVTSRR